MRIIETFEANGVEYTTWKCDDCGLTITTLEGGEPCECIRCLAIQVNKEVDAENDIVS